MIVRDEEVYPLRSVVRLKKTGEFAMILDHNFQKDGRGFLNYLASIEGRGVGLYAVYHNDIDLEHLPGGLPSTAATINSSNVDSGDLSAK